MRYNYSMVNPQVMSDANSELVDELFADWSLEDTPEALLDEQFFRDFHSSQNCLAAVGGVSSRELGEDLGPLLRIDGSEW
jgi:hypothetical protein